MRRERARSALSICPAKGCGRPFDTLQPQSWPTKATVVLPTFKTQITIVKDAMARYWTCHWQNRFWRTKSIPSIKRFALQAATGFASAESREAMRKANRHPIFRPSVCWCYD